MKKLKEAAEKLVVGRIEFSPYTPEIIPEMASQLGRPKVTASPQNSLLREPREKVGFSQQDKAQISIALSHICELQKAYGKTVSSLETIVNGFLWAFEGYSMPTILGGLREFVKRQNEIPTPADIIAIIDPPSQPLCGRTYSAIKKRIIEGTSFVSRDEKYYCQRYEQQEIAKVK